MKKVIFIFAVLFLCLNVSTSPVHVGAVEMEETDSEIVVEEQKSIGILEDLYYRLFEKDTKDFFDYVLLAIFIIGLLIVMVLQNTHRYTVTIIDSPKTSSKKEEVIEEDKIIYQEEPIIEKKKKEHKKKSD